MAAIDEAVSMLEMSLKGCRAVLAEGEAPLQRRLAWLASELERLAGEAYRLADEADERPDLGDLCLCRKAPCECVVEPRRPVIPCNPHTVNHLGHCTRCGSRVDDFLT